MLIWYTLISHYLSHLRKLPKIHQVHPQPASALATLPLRTCRFSKRDSDKTALPCPAAGDQHEAKKSGWGTYKWLYLSYIILLYSCIRVILEDPLTWVPGWKYFVSWAMIISLDAVCSMTIQLKPIVWKRHFVQICVTPPKIKRVPWTKESSAKVTPWNVTVHLNLAIFILHPFLNPKW